MTHTPTVLITGGSSGFGRQTAQHFLDRGWRVVATARTPAAVAWPASDRLRTLALDLTHSAGIAQAVADAGPVDVLVNNAGVGLMAALEATPLDTLRETFETNVFGAMAMAQAVLPQFRERGAGVIVNVGSSVTLKALPLLSVYSASKAAMDAFAASLALEVAGFGVRVHGVQPGRAPGTPFAATARGRLEQPVPPAYAAVMQAIAAARHAATAVTHAQDLADAVWRAATDPACPRLLPAGADAWALAAEAGGHPAMQSIAA